MKRNVGRAWRRVLAVQAAVALLAALVASLFGSVHGWSALSGGIIALAISGLFASKVFTTYRADQPGRLTGALYRAQFYKLILAGMLFGVVFAWLRPIHPATLLGVFFIVYLASPLAAHKSGKTL